MQIPDFDPFLSPRPQEGHLGGHGEVGYRLVSMQRHS